MYSYLDNAILPCAQDLFFRGPRLGPVEVKSFFSWLKLSNFINSTNPEKHLKHIKMCSSLEVQGLFKRQVPRGLELDLLRNHLSSLPLTPWVKERVSWGFTGLNRQRPACLLFMSLLHIPPANIWWRVLGTFPCSRLNEQLRCVPFLLVLTWLPVLFCSSGEETTSVWCCVYLHRGHRPSVWGTRNVQSCVCFPELWFEKTHGPFSYVFTDM